MERPVGPLARIMRVTSPSHYAAHSDRGQCLLRCRSRHRGPTPTSPMAKFFNGPLRGVGSESRLCFSFGGAKQTHWGPPKTGPYQRKRWSHARNISRKCAGACLHKSSSDSSGGGRKNPGKSLSWRSPALQRVGYPRKVAAREWWAAHIRGPSALRPLVEPKSKRWPLSWGFQSSKVKTSLGKTELTN